MTEIGLFLSSEEHDPTALVAQAQHAEAAGFHSLLISDHYHPWTDRQGQSGFVWSVIGAIAATTGHRVTTGVTCPTVRIHPAVLAQAAATAQLLLGGRFVLGVGSGEALNEHVTGGRWPPADVRQEMLEEAVEILRRLWQGGLVSHRGRYYEVDRARIYSRPEQPPPVLVSAFGPRAATLAARIGDGLVTTSPDPELLGAWRDAGGHGPVVGSVKVCWGPDEQAARRLAHELWATDSLPGQLNQELVVPAEFEAATSLVTEEQVAGAISCGPDPEVHEAAIRPLLEAGFDEVYVNQIGPQQDGFLDFWRKELAGRLT